jgi:hypothetical protein
VLGTKFYLFKRSTNLSHPEILNYDDEGKSLANSSFNYTLPMKMMIENRTSKLRIEPRNCTKSVVVLLRSTFPCCKWFLSLVVAVNLVSNSSLDYRLQYHVIFPIVSLIFFLNLVVKRSLY